MLTIDVSSDIVLEYLAEGAANVVYRIQQAPSSPSSGAGADLDELVDYPPTEVSLWENPVFAGKLLRLRKATPSAVAVSISDSQFTKHIAPLFPAKNLVGQELIGVTKSLIDDLNERLRLRESQGLRPEKRHGIYVDTSEEYGCLVTDMSCRSIQNSAYTCLEFKPKWLSQSPSAPIGARRCRTCALGAKKAWTSSRGDGLDGHRIASFCPLGLVSGSKSVLTDTVASLVKQQCPEVKAEIDLCGRVVDFLQQSRLLHHLQAIQMEKDPVGVLLANLSSSDFLTAMTVRDCSLFLKVLKRE